MPHFASIHLDDEKFKKLEQVVKVYLRTTRPKFLTALALQFSEQYHSGEIPDWPPRFVLRPDIEAKKKVSPRKGNRPSGKQKRSKREQP